MELPQRLSDRAYLLAYDPAKGRITNWTHRGHVLNAAALTELWLDNRLRDANKRATAVPAPGGRRPGQPLPALEASLLEKIGEAAPKRWKRWIRKADRDTEKLVRERLSKDRVIRVEDRSALGVVTWKRVRVRDPRVAKELVDRCRRAVLDPNPVDRVDPLDAALAAMVAAAEWNTVFSGRERRQHRARIKELALRSGPAVKALRDVVSDDQAAAAA